MSRPRPEVHTVVLWCDTPQPGHPHGKPTLHDYLTTRETHVRSILPNGEFGTEEPAWEHIFRCRVTNSDRRYGVEERLMS